MLFNQKEFAEFDGISVVHHELLVQCVDCKSFVVQDAVVMVPVTVSRTVRRRRKLKHKALCVPYCVVCYDA